MKSGNKFRKRNLQHWYWAVLQCGYFAFVFCISWKLIEESLLLREGSTLYWVPSHLRQFISDNKKEHYLIQTFIMLVNWAPVKALRQMIYWPPDHEGTCPSCWEVLSPWRLMGRSDRFPGRGVYRKQLVQQWGWRLTLISDRNFVAVIPSKRLTLIFKFVFCGQSFVKLSKKTETGWWDSGLLNWH